MGGGDAMERAHKACELRTGKAKLHGEGVVMAGSSALGAIRRWTLCIAALASLTAPLTHVIAAPAAAAPSPAPAKKPDPKSLETLLKQGHDALAGGEYIAARDAFLDATTIDSKHFDALHGLGVAYMYLNDFHHAREPMEKALTANPAATR